MSLFDDEWSTNTTLRSQYQDSESTSTQRTERGVAYYLPQPSSRRQRDPTEPRQSENCQAILSGDQRPNQQIFDLFNKRQNQQIKTAFNFFGRLDSSASSLQDEDFSFEYQNQRVNELLGMTARHSYLLPPLVRTKLTRILNLAKARIQYYPYSDKQYTKLLSLCQTLERVYEYVGSKRNAQMRQKETDRGYQHFVQEYETKPRRQAMYYLQSEKVSKRRISLAEYIADNEDYFRDGKWKDIMFAVQQNIEEFNADHESDANKEVQKIKRKIGWGQNIHMDQHNRDISCLGCTPYFLMHAPINDYHINKTKLALLPNISSLLDSTKKPETLRLLRQEICGLANCGGGVILFDCERSYLNIVPRGEFLIKSETDQITNAIAEAALGVFPKPSWTVQFVPVAKDPLSSANLSLGAKPEFFESLVVGRVVVRPGPRAVRYCYDKGNNEFEAFYRYKSIFSTLDLHVKKQAVAPEEVVKEATAVSDKSWVERLLSSPHSCYRHNACQPNKEPVVWEKKPEAQTKSADFESRFVFASAMVAKKQNLAQITSKLRKYNFDFELVHPFGHHNLRGASATAILYHNDPFAQILATVSYNKEFQFDGRFVVVVFITDLIRLTERTRRKSLPQSDQDALQSWASNEFKGQNLSLKLYDYTNEKGESELYLKVTNGEGKVHRACTLLLYLVLNHHNEKAILRNPKDIEKIFQVKKGTSS